MKAQYSAAEAQVKIQEATSGLSGEMSDVGMAIQRAQDKTEQMKARAAAVEELVATGAIDDSQRARHQRSTARSPRSPPARRSTRSWPGCAQELEAPAGRPSCESGAPPGAAEAPPAAEPRRRAGRRRRAVNVQVPGIGAQPRRRTYVRYAAGMRWSARRPPARPVRAASSGTLPSVEYLAGQRAPDRQHACRSHRGCRSGTRSTPTAAAAHACSYCFARPTHEYLGLNAGEDFERRIVVKVNAVERLRPRAATIPPGGAS